MGIELSAQPLHTHRLDCESTELRDTSSGQPQPPLTILSEKQPIVTNTVMVTTRPHGPHHWKGLSPLGVVLTLVPRADHMRGWGTAEETERRG